MSVDTYTDPDRLHYKTILDTISQKPFSISTAQEHESLVEGSIISTPQGHARKAESGWEFFGKEGVFPIEGEHQVIRRGWLYIPEQPQVTLGETGIVAAHKYLIMEHLNEFNENTYTDFRQLLELPKGSIISTMKNDYQRFNNGWGAPGSELLTSSQGIVRYHKAHLIHKA